MKYRMDLCVESCSGYQTFEVEANSQQEAFDKFNNGETEIIDSEVEVTALSASSVDMFYEYPEEVTEPSVVRQEDKDILKRVIDKEGFTYAMVHYSNYNGSVKFNHVHDKRFHELRDEVINSMEALRSYCEDQIDEEVNY